MDEFWFNFLVQAIGIVAAASTIISYQFKNNKIYLSFQVFSGCMFGLQFYLSHAYAAMFLNLMSAVRAVVYIFLDKRGKTSHIIAGVIIALANAFLAFASWRFFGEYWYIALITGLAQVVGTIALIINTPEVIRYVQLGCVSPCWLFNNIFYRSIGGIITESFSIVSIIVSLIRFKLLNKKQFSIEENRQE